ncbi:MAG: hypothetical protein KDA85_13815 [Planctomycetaceae bacterium]|nr:hypothetical protein [Planctomycetaceae bacterium]
MPRSNQISPEARRNTPDGDLSHSRRKAGSVSRIALMLLRRTHLYAGLFLCPWVLLYGATAFLFNHPTWFSSQFQREFAANDLPGDPLKSLPLPAELATQIVAAINSTHSTTYRLVNPGNAAWERGGLAALVDDKQHGHLQISFYPNGSGGQVRPARGPRSPRNGREPQRDSRGRDGDSAAESTLSGGEQLRNQEDESNRLQRESPKSPRRESPSGSEPPQDRDAGMDRKNAPTPFAVSSGLEFTNSPVNILQQAVPDVLQSTGLRSARIISIDISPLTFQISDEKTIWNARYNAAEGSLTGQIAAPSDTQKPSPPLRNFLTALHKTHGYPADEGQPGFWWAVCVDAMAAFMIFWAGSGILMWWQIRRTRIVGTAILLLSLLTATWLTFAIHQAVTP